MAHPPRRWPPEAAPLLKKLRAVLAKLPDATEKEAWAAPTFRAKGRMFATFVCDHHGDGRLALWINAHPEMQRLAVSDDPRHFFVPPYVGKKGWLGVRLDGRLSWKRVEELFRGAHRFTLGAS